MTRPAFRSSAVRRLTSLVSALAAAAAAACADATSPSDGSKVLGVGGGGGGPDTTGPRVYDRYTYAGRLIWPSRDSLRPWSPVAGMPVVLVRVDEERGTLVPLASAVTDADGRYVVSDPTKTSEGLLAVRAIPAADSPFRPSALARALTAVPENARYANLSLERKDDPPLPAPLSAFHGEVVDAPAWGAAGPAMPGVVLGLQRILKERWTIGVDEPQRELSPVISYGVSDAEGRFAIAPAEGPGDYLLHVHSPPGYYFFWHPGRTLSVNTPLQTHVVLGTHPLVIRLGKTGG